MDHIAERLDLQSLDLPDTAHPDVPPLFLMNVQFPRADDPKVFGADDGPGCSVCFYFRIAAATLAELHGPASLRSPALTLLAEWCRLAPDDPNFRGRFKVYEKSSTWGACARRADQKQKQKRARQWDASCFHFLKSF